MLTTEIAALANGFNWYICNVYSDRRRVTHLGKCKCIVDDFVNILLRRRCHETFIILHGHLKLMERCACRLGLYDLSFYGDISYSNAYRVGRTKFEDDGRRVAVKRDLPYMS